MGQLAFACWQRANGRASAARQVQNAQGGDLRGLLVDHQQRRVLRRQQVAADRVAKSWVHPRAVAEVEADRLHHLERGAGGEDVGGREHARVLLDHRCGCGGRALVQAALERGPGVVAVLHEVGRRVDGVERLPGAGGDVRHVLLVQGDVLAGAEPAQVAADEVLPRVGERVRRRLEVARDVLGQVREVNRRPARVDDVDEHQRVVVGQVDEDVVGRVVGAVPGELDAFAADLERAAVLERLLVAEAARDRRRAAAAAASPRARCA